MIAGKLFGFPVEEGLFETVIDILKNEYSLVDGKLESSTGDYRVLVWEDENGIGRYRVHCYVNMDWKIPDDGKRRDVFIFHYWLNEARFDREVFSRDPMREPLQRILELSENRYDTDHMFLETTVDELEKSILGAQK
jgi:hypothetical protein